MNNYSDEVISAIQDTLDYENTEYIIKRFESIEDFPRRFVANDVCLTLLKNNERCETILSFLVEDVDDGVFKLWKDTALGHFVAKDWKRTNKDIEFYNNYLEMHVTIKEINMVILLRQLDEDILSDEEFDEYSDLSNDGNHYAVIKIFIEDVESYSMNSEFEDDLSQYVIEEEPAPKRGRKAAKDDEDDEDDEDLESSDSPTYFQSEQLF